MRDKLYSLLWILYLIFLTETLVFVPVTLIMPSQTAILLLWIVALALTRYIMTRRSEGVAELPPDDLEIKIYPWRFRGRNLADYMDYFNDLIDDNDLVDDLA